jgi:hypothetical protein
MADTDVISLDDAMAVISMTGSGADHGLQVELFVSAVSDLLDDLCGPIVEREIADEIHDVRLYDPLILRYQPVVSVGTVTEYAQGVATALLAEDNITSGTFLLRDGMIHRRDTFGPSTWLGSIVYVTYTAGRYASTEDVGARFKLAACEIVAREWPQYASAWSRGAGVFDAPEGSLGYFKSVRPVVEQWLSDELKAPVVA